MSVYLDVSGNMFDIRKIFQRASIFVYTIFSNTLDKFYIQRTISISTTLYLKLLPISNKKLVPLEICVLSKLFLSLYLELLYLEQKSWTISLSISNFFPSKGPFTQQIEQKCLIFENSNVIKTFEIRKFDCNQNITKCKGFVLN